ncbi:MAG: hypothetical protein R2911_42385 [Caldilineaceae bacterium]
MAPEAGGDAAAAHCSRLESRGCEGRAGSHRSTRRGSLNWSPARPPPCPNRSPLALWGR